MSHVISCFFFNDTATTEIYTLSLHDALPISCCMIWDGRASTRSCSARSGPGPGRTAFPPGPVNGARSIRPLRTAGRRRRSEEHTSELQSRLHLVCRLLLEKKKSTKLSNVTQH